MPRKITFPRALWISNESATTGEAREDFDPCSTHSYFLYGMMISRPSVDAGGTLGLSASIVSLPRAMKCLSAAATGLGWWILLFMRDLTAGLTLAKPGRGSLI